MFQTKPGLAFKKSSMDLVTTPAQSPRALSRQKSFVLGVVTAGLKFIGPSRTFSGITGKAEELGYGLLLKELASFNSNNVKPLLQWFKSHQVDGIIWAAPEIEDNRYWLKISYRKLISRSSS